MTRWIWIGAGICFALGVFVNPWCFAAAAVLAIIAAIGGIGKSQSPQLPGLPHPTRQEEICPGCGTKTECRDRVPDTWTHPSMATWRKRVCRNCFAEIKRRKYREQAPKQDEAWQLAHAHRTRPTYLGKQTWECPDCKKRTSRLVEVSIKEINAFRRSGIAMPFTAVCEDCYKRANRIANK